MLLQLDLCSLFDPAQKGPIYVWLHYDNVNQHIQIWHILTEIGSGTYIYINKKKLDKFILDEYVTHMNKYKN